MTIKQLEKIEDLKIGEIIIHKETGQHYVVTEALGPVAIAVKTTHLSNPTDWEVIKCCEGNND